MLFVVQACAPTRDAGVELDAGTGTAITPRAVHRQMGSIVLGEPIGVAVSFSGAVYLADGAPGRLLIWDDPVGSAQEFQLPAQNPGFYTSDLATHGFFVYAVDAVGRSLLRFDKHGAYRDVLINFSEFGDGRRVSPFGIDTDNGGRIVVTDIENHQVLLLDSYLNLEVAFGNYGSFPGQFIAPEGVAFNDNNELIVADTGNARIQVLSETGTVLRTVPLQGRPSPLRLPRRAVESDSGWLYVADPGAGRVFVFDANGVLVDALFPVGEERFQPTDVELGGDGALYVTDQGTRALFVFDALQ